MVGWWLVAGVYAAGVLYLSLIPVDVDVPGHFLDKLVHVWEYLFFAWILVQAVRTQRLREREYLVLAWLYATSFGLLVELLQALVPWRSADIMDAFSNAIGAAFGVWLGQRIPRPARRSS